MELSFLKTNNFPETEKIIYQTKSKNRFFMLSFRSTELCHNPESYTTTKRTKTEKKQ